MARAVEAVNLQATKRRHKVLLDDVLVRLASVGLQIGLVRDPLTQESSDRVFRRVLANAGSIRTGIVSKSSPPPDEWLEASSANWRKRRYSLRGLSHCRPASSSQSLVYNDLCDDGAAVRVPRRIEAFELERRRGIGRGEPPTLPVVNAMVDVVTR